MNDGVFWRQAVRSLRRKRNVVDEARVDARAEPRELFVQFVAHDVSQKSAGRRALNEAAMTCRQLRQQRGDFVIEHGSEALPQPRRLEVIEEADHVEAQQHLGTGVPPGVLQRPEASCGGLVRR